jgi:hypothetical protein
MAGVRFLLCAAALLGARAQLSPTSTPGAVGCVARYIRVENTPGVANQNFYVRSLPSTQKMEPILSPANARHRPLPRAPRRKSTRLWLED